MEIMWINLVIVYTSSLLSRYFSISKPNWLLPKPNKIFVFIVLLSFCIISGLRKNIGDTYFYMHSYEIKKFTWSSINYKADFGFDILQMFLQKVSHDPQFLILTVAIITNLLIIAVLYKYSRVFELSIYVFITSGMFTTSMNGIRQYLAAAIVFVAIKYIMEGNFVKYLLIILIASLIHKSALVLIPIYFIVRRKSWTKVTFFLLILSIFIVLGFNKFSDLLFSALSDTQYGHYENFTEGGANILRVAVTAVPIIIAYLGRDKLRELWPKSDYVVNMSIIGLFFMIISMQNWIFARFDIYFGLYNLILISWIPKLFYKNTSMVIYYAILLCYFLFYFYEEVITYGLVYKSDYLFW